MSYGFTMITAKLAVFPFFPPRDSQVVGLDGNEVCLAVPGGETRLPLPFYDGAPCNVVSATVDSPDGPAPLSLLVPDPAGSKQMSVSISEDRGMWFAVAHVGPRTA